MSISKSAKPLPPPFPKSHRYGIQSSKNNGSVQELLSAEKMSTLHQVIEDKKELGQRRNMDPLGRSINRGTVFPPCVHEEGFRFGFTEAGDAENTAAAILFNKDSKIEQRGQLLEKLNEVTRPTNRNYTYPKGMDPTENRFGGKGPATVKPQLGEEHIKESSVQMCMDWVPETCIGKRPEEPAPVPIKEEATFIGPRLDNNSWGARECIMGVGRGEKGEWDSAPTTKDLGKSMLAIRYGLVNNMPEDHTFGSSSSNMASTGGAKCLAGDPDIRAGHLLAPKKTDSIGKQWTAQRQDEELRQLALETGLVSSAEEVDSVLASLEKPASLASFHAALLESLHPLKK